VSFLAMAKTKFIGFEVSGGKMKFLIVFFSQFASGKMT
jgi:hypothetical protein